MSASVYCSSSVRSNETGNHPNAVTGLIVDRDCMFAEMIPKWFIVSTKRCQPLPTFRAVWVLIRLVIYRLVTSKFGYWADSDQIQYVG